ncbi:hypothetical protein GTCCBUS3UF5_32040 [Geobacillus thermoleovorans CCB_US3_UF5]|uniref:Uncharacterized protein n=1 Tax=Geobacillus thermoleovorans CCB_US3_UF5 TaxID=1111068 RepID=A0ABM5MLY6_GEOTH|nr:hypothetical protein GTCCBUS3UF5_32040 [Geobacillus thermoleovorans CCB_US3_UF5]
MVSSPSISILSATKIVSRLNSLRSRLPVLPSMRAGQTIKGLAME